MKTLVASAYVALGTTLLGLSASQSAEPPRPLYQKLPVVPRDRGLGTLSIDAHILLKPETGAAPSTSVADAKEKFDARAAEAIRYTVDHRDRFLRAKDPQGKPIGDPTGSNNELDFGLALLAMMAYQDYFNDTATAHGADFRKDVNTMLWGQVPGTKGSSIEGHDVYVPGTKILVKRVDRHGEYDVLLQSYVPLYYKYYDALDPKVRKKLIDELLNIKGAYDGDAYDSYRYISPPIVIPVPFFPYVIPVVVNLRIPGTENHIFIIETARYLTNQLLFQQTWDPQYDNNHNGGEGKPPLVDVFLRMLQKVLISDFEEYNSRPYQNYTMVALLNLATYSYDDRVTLAARMALDYVSAKVAVSTCDLRRSTPLRRRNEPDYYGPDSKLIHGVDVDPQTYFYAGLAGTTAIWGGYVDSSAAYAIVHAGLRDYRVPDSTLDLFINPWKYYQRFHHAALTVRGDAHQFVDELYVRSPGYLISAGGNPTDYSGVANIYVDGINMSSPGDDPDRGLAVPITVIPALSADSVTRNTLGNIIQLGKFGTDVATRRNMGVAQDFACGYFTYVPPVYSGSYLGRPVNETVIVKPPHWTFIDHSNGGTGYYLAIYRFDGDAEGSGFVEIFDVASLPVVTFQDFVNGGHGVTGVWTRYGSNPGWTVPGENSYITQTGQSIRYRISGATSEIISTSAAPGNAWPLHHDQFLYGTIIP